MITYRRQAGFSLVELIVVMVVSGVMALMTISIMRLPVNAYVDTARRAKLVDSADLAIRRMQRDIRAALPNSIRVSSDGLGLELLHVVDGGRYRALLPDNGTGSEDVLDFFSVDSSFDVLGGLENFSEINFNNDFISIYPLDEPGTNPYAGENISRVLAGSTENNFKINPKRFEFSSPKQRFFVFSHPITYRCDVSATQREERFLYRYKKYPISATQVNVPTVTPSIQANYMDSCQFSYGSASNTRAATVTISLVLSTNGQEKVSVIHQVHIANQV